MPTINEIKTREIADTPVLLFECTLPSGAIERWSTHEVQFAGQTYSARVRKHNLFELRSLSEDGVDGMPKLSLTLDNVDSNISQLERTAGLKGAKLLVRFAFFDVSTSQPTSETQVVFRGVANPPEELTESTARLSFVNRLALQRTFLPDVRIQRRCPWMFPSNLQQRQQATSGGDEGKYSPFFRCGYSPDITGGIGSLNGTVPYTSCNYTRGDCEDRGMFSTDSQGRVTQRFGGIEFVPASILVKSFGEKSSHFSSTASNDGKYNEVVPVVYGTAWLRPPVVFARNDGNLTHMEVLLSLGDIQGVLKVIVNGVEIPVARTDSSMTATGWYNVISLGNRTGAFDLNFTQPNGTPAGDPYGSMAYMLLVVPNRISDGKGTPRIEVLMQGIKLSRFGAAGGYIDDAFTNNPAWILLDMIRRCGWQIGEIDTASFAAAAAYCDAQIETYDLNGNPRQIPRFQCNLVIGKRRAASDVIRGVRSGSGLFLRYGPDGNIQAGIESAIGVQHPTKPAGSNSTQQLNGGWPAYEFGDGTNGFGGILRRPTGEPSLRLWSRSTVDSPNRYSVEFQDEFNLFQQDSLSVVDVEDSLATGQEISASLSALGLPNFNQAARVIRAQLNRSLRGNRYIEFETGLRGIGLTPGDLITVTYLKEGLDRELFRIVRIAPSTNYATSLVCAQLHKDDWYLGSSATDLGLIGGGIEPGISAGAPRPLLGSVLTASGSDFGLTEMINGTSDGGYNVQLRAEYLVPPTPAVGGPSTPLLSLIATATPTGGTLAGGQAFYYAVSATDTDGVASLPSFVVLGETPAGPNTCTVRLDNLSFGPTATAFHVYRGPSPQQLVRIASTVALASSYVDAGGSSAIGVPADPHFHHANFYWRLELVPETVVVSATSTTVANASLGMIADEYRGRLVRITQGRGAGQERQVLSNTASTLTISEAWNVVPDTTSRFVVSEEAWKFGAASRTSPAEFEIPNRDGAVVQVSGRAANIHGLESAYELAPLTRHVIAGAGGLAGDDAVPGEPVFGVSVDGRGAVEIAGIGFSSLNNTRSIETGTSTLHYFDETVSSALPLLAIAVSASETALDLSVAGPASVGALLLIEAELCRVTAIENAGTRYVVERGALGTTAGAHAASTPVQSLATHVDVLSFSRAFFGTPASGSYSYRTELPNCRVVAAELFVTNSFGASPVGAVQFANTVYKGLRTLSGGQFTLQVEGYLAIQDGAVPPLSIDRSVAVRDVFATVLDAPQLVPVQLRLTVNGMGWCNLTIPAGQSSSNVVSGTTLTPLAANSLLGLDIVSVGATVDSTPGRDLTVTVRL